jgi:tRNA uridine 5-carbamoylmethylation protein Kti12
MSGEGPGYWIIISTLITVVAPILARYAEGIITRFLDRISSLSTIQHKWKHSVQLVSNTTISSFNSRSRVNNAYKSVIFHLISKHATGGPNHLRQKVLTDRSDQDAEDYEDDYLNRNFNFTVNAYNTPVLLDEATKTYVIPSREEITHRETFTANDILNIVSNHSTSTQILDLISNCQIAYLEHMRRYNKAGKIKYITFRISKETPAIQSNSNSSYPPHKSQSDNDSSVKRCPSWDIRDFTSSKTFDNVFFTDKPRILQQIKHFLNGEDFYRHRGIPWTLNILLYGVPGCGKTSFIKALSNMLNRHILDVSLSAIKTTDDFRHAFNTEMFKDIYIPIDKRIIVLEDIDCMGSDILTDRSKKSATTTTPSSDTEDQMNMSCFLNTLDGIHEQHGRIVIATTNCVDTLDPAVLRRFNVKVHFTHLTRPLAQSIINNYFNEDVPLPDSWIPNNVTGSTLTQLCMQFQDDPEMLIHYLT